MNYLEEAFVFFKLDKFSLKVKEQLASSKKIYCVDNGLVYAKGVQVKQGYRRLFENLVAIELSS